MRNSLRHLTVQMPFCKGNAKVFNITPVNTNIAVWLISKKKPKLDIKPPTKLKIFRITTLACYNEGFHKLYILIADSSIH